MSAPPTSNSQPHAGTSSSSTIPHPYNPSTQITTTFKPLTHPLNPAATFLTADLSTRTGLQHTAIKMNRIPPGADSTECHAHKDTEEWFYILSGEGEMVLRAVVDGYGDKGLQEEFGKTGVEEELIPIAPGDFIGFPRAAARAHMFRNTGTEELVYILGGERSANDVVDYPVARKRLLVKEGQREYVDL
ncbi:RmlC-like cupin domain-containing protein [Fimicolochytrium jonesii]|uniref:RmlC-like cupin domain-containing protein n=1 Tax=Fimicolochytrium jonesii TaxID=1396493 RepID=UPI0022FE4F3C|nr:RmlC-like cupin domain-containing protein [Fimicolochytrium jonesii]KAI8823042.1 RmlC-like cupin domain-containing protein [Fimicolochytrium jonesii]